MKKNDKHRTILFRYTELLKTTTEEQPDKAKFIALEYYYDILASEWGMKISSIRKIINKQLKRNKNVWR